MMMANILIIIERMFEIDLYSFFIKRKFLLFSPSDVSMGEFDDEKRRTYLVKYAEGDGFASDGQNDDQANFSTAV